MKGSKTILQKITPLLLTLAVVLSACGTAAPSASTATSATIEATTTETTAAVSESTEAATETSAVSESAATPPAAKKYDPAITVTAVKSLSDLPQKALAKKEDVIQDNIWNRAYLDELGINVKYLWSVPNAQYEQKLNVAISANDLPDIIECNARQFKLLVDSGVATDMTQLFKDNASPFTMQMMDADKNTALSQATIGGKLMALPAVSGNIDNCSILWIRADWLKALNLEAPKTIDEMVKVAEAFVKNDPDQNGKADTLGLGLVKDLVGTGFAVLDGFFEGYHAYPSGWLKDASGNLSFGGVQPEVKSALAKLAEMYKAGLIDKEFGVKDGGKVAEGTTNGNIGMVYGQHWLPFWPFQDSKNKNDKADWQAYPIPSIDGTPAKPMINGSAGNYFVINNASMKNPEAAVTLYNFYYDKDPALSPKYDVRFHGINGEQETIPDQNWEWAVIKTFFPTQNLFIHQQVAKYYDTKDEKILDNLWIKDNVTQIDKYMAGEKTLWSTYAWSGITGSAFNVVDNYVKNEQVQLNSYIKADTTSMTEKGATIKQLRDETFTKIIMGVLPSDEFEKYVASWKSLGGDDITSEVNANK
jgi:putative aldouronate transport system substrate-binding protein